MQCHLLGPLRVVADDGQDRTPGSAQQRRLLTLLAAHIPDAVSVDTIEDLLWPAGAPSANALQALVSKLRKLVAPGLIVQEGLGYALRGVDTDISRFGELVAAGRHAEAEELVRGRPLADLGDAPSAIPLRARWESDIEAARAARLESAVEADPSGAVGELRALVADQPLVETWWRLLMLAEYRSGRPADALRTFQRARATIVEELGVEPSPVLVDLEHRMLGGDPTLAIPADRPHSAAAVPPSGRRTRRLPATLSSFVGRVGVLAALESAITEHRLVTLTGPGGVGKTTTALELARRAAPDHSSWVALAPLGDRDAIVREIARAVGLPESEQGVPGTIGQYSDPLDRVTDLLSTRREVLIVDNCEHVIDTVAEIVHRLLIDCPEVSVVATSRERLGVPGEHLVALPPLPADEAVELFVARARDSGAAVDPDDLPRVDALCGHLDGLPLAIELAAARLRTVSVGALLDGLTDRFALLSRGSRTVEERQRTLRAVVDWSHDLLEPGDRVVFRRLAAFVGGCDALAARYVCTGAAADGPTITPADVDAALERLVDKSLVVATTGEDVTRFQLLQTLRAYAHDRLVEAGELESTLVRHAQFFADALQPARHGLLGADQRTWFTFLGRERQNVDAALDTAIARDDAQLALEIVTPIGWYFFMMGELEQGREMLGGALACSTPSEPELRAMALGFLGWLETNGPNVERAVAITGEAVSMLDRVADPWARAIIADMHAMSQFFAGRLDSVSRFLPEAQRLAAESGDPWVVAITKVVHGEILQFGGDSLAAEREFIEAAEMFDEVGDQFAYAVSITEASEVAEQFGHYDRAVDMLEHGIEIAEQVGFSSHPSAMRARLGNIEILRGNLDVAERYHQSLVEDPIAAGVPWLQAMARFGLSMIARRRGDLDTAELHLEAAWALPRSQSVPYLRTLLQVGLGFLAEQRGDAEAAIAYQLDALATAERLRTPRGTAYALEGCAAAFALVDDPETTRLATRLLGHADRLRRDSGGPMPDAERFDLDRADRRLRAALGDAFDAEFAAGAAADTAALIASIRRPVTTG